MNASGNHGVRDFLHRRAFVYFKNYRRHDFTHRARRRLLDMERSQLFGSEAAFPTVEIIIMRLIGAQPRFGQAVVARNVGS